MQRAVKIRLLPTKEQECLFWKSAGTARWAYNYFLEANEAAYKAWLKNDKVGKRSVSEGEIRKHINNVLKKTTHTWLKEVGSNVMKQAVKDANLALQRYFKGISGKPKFKSRHRSKISFYVNYESLVRKPNGFHGEKIGFVKTAAPLPKIPKGKKYANPHISFDGRYWYLSVGYEVQQEETELTGGSLGIDLGIKSLAIVSNEDATETHFYKNINKSAEVRRLEKKLKREQRKASRKLESNIKSHDKNRHPIWIRPLRECRNLDKQNKKIQLIHKRLTDIRNNHLHQTTSEIVKTKPSQIVMENLNVKGMMKNKHLSEAIAKQKFYEFKRQIQYKAEMYGIKVIEVDRFYASSKTCSHCGNVKKDLKLSDRIYVCPVCGAKLDRDLNAAINLANYKMA
ncbi:putative transposase OrfB [Selenomonas ruminantium subsp. lactilytica TAM6421]|uniref:Putative transposase OrfB n=1 Tax=Selenomonas ruminantium subsp. lactilytica (strain NBRC 103574 / TAM6421) TaxID=927704 RepID=I0GTU9_SELRL|nr:RNA-guided endonuclease TnpB family protein [Selenomonas ruminantium]BAL83989.1 putative transposase OrfB [Selenomonas ruminantium subsp. lactilytica TAM6421]BAL84186.1 putative transposase OrfB [Selenomonas ruminantium subsp. lactilytica TAM6421]